VCYIYIIFITFPFVSYFTVCSSEGTIDDVCANLYLQEAGCESFQVTQNVCATFKN
jgi:hypothetical protein